MVGSAGTDFGVEIGGKGVTNETVGTLSDGSSSCADSFLVGSAFIPGIGGAEGILPVKGP